MPGGLWYNSGGRPVLGDIARRLKQVHADDVAILTACGGQIAGLRNKVINGGMEVAQRFAGAPMNLALNTIQYGGPDRMVSALAATTGSATLARQYVAFGSTGYAMQMGSITTTGTTSMSSGSYLEAVDICDMASRTVSLGAWVWQDFGSTLLFYPEFHKFNARDTTSSGFTQIFSGPPTSVPNQTWTFVPATWTFGANDVVNGGYVRMLMPGAAAVTGKFFYMTDLQFELAPAPTATEKRNYVLEELLCKRYYYEIYPQAASAPIAQGSLFTSSELYPVIEFPGAPMRKSPIITGSSPGDFTIFSNGITGACTTVGVGQVSPHSAELYFAKTGFTAGDSGWVRTSNGNARFTFDSEIT